MTAGADVGLAVTSAGDSALLRRRRSQISSLNRGGAHDAHDADDAHDAHDAHWGRWHHLPTVTLAARRGRAPRSAAGGTFHVAGSGTDIFNTSRLVPFR